MKSLLELRVERNLTHKEIGDLLKINSNTIRQTESGTTCPSPRTRVQIESLFREKINWLNVPIIKVKAINPPVDWNFTEKKFRRLLQMIKSLPKHEQNAFLSAALIHLQSLSKELK